MLTDLRHASRGLLRSPGFTATAVLILSVGIGATTAMFTGRAFMAAENRPGPDQPVAHVETLSNLVDHSVAQPRANSMLLSFFAAVAVLFAVIGVYGLLAYTVTQRAPELGIRMALGGQPHDILRMILADGGRLVLAGIALGVPAAIAAATTLRTLLFGVGPADFAAISAAVLVMLGVGAAASYLPARRAMRVDPLSALRTE